MAGVNFLIFEDLNVVILAMIKMLSIQGVIPMNSESSVPIEHQYVPQAHQGLHDFLYSSAEEHAVDAPTQTSPQLTHGIIALESWCEQAKNTKIAGVYAVLNSDRITQYIGYSRNVALSLRGHLNQKGPDICAWVKIERFKFPKRDAMEQLKNEWIAALPSPPVGNTDGTWAKTIKDASSQVMSKAERDAFEEKKLKLRRAMADTTLKHEPAIVPHSTQKQQELAAAMKDDNWSAVIREQTKDTQV